jgi:hypothetical protein
MLRWQGLVDNLILVALERFEYIGVNEQSVILWPGFTTLSK